MTYRGNNPRRRGDEFAQSGRDTGRGEQPPRARGRLPARRRQIGDRIRAVRSERKLSQEKLAEHAGLDRKTVNRIEQAANSPMLDHLLLIAAALDVSLADLVR
jgi:DNA-binding XRE family transcriptional regulator